MRLLIHAGIKNKQCTQTGFQSNRGYQRGDLMSLTPGLRSWYSWSAALFERWLYSSHVDRVVGVCARIPMYRSIQCYREALWVWAFGTYDTNTILGSRPSRLSILFIWGMAWLNVPLLRHMGPLLFTSTDLNPSMDKYWNPLSRVGWNYLSQTSTEVWKWISIFIPHLIALMVT